MTKGVLGLMNMFETTKNKKSHVFHERDRAMDAMQMDLTQTGDIDHASPVQQKLLSLRQQIRQLETAGRCHLADSKVASTGCQSLDQLLPEKGLVPGTITEWFSANPGSGAEVMSLIAAREACAAGGRDGRALVVIDTNHSFYPPAAKAWGINLRNTIVIRPERKAADRGRMGNRPKREIFWAIDQALRCPAVAAVWGSLEHIGERWFRRFQLSAEESGAMGLFVRSQRMQSFPSWAEVQWLVGGQRLEVRRERLGARGSSPPPSILSSHTSSNSPRTSRLTPRASLDRYLNLQLIRCRGGRPGGYVSLKVDFSTGVLEVVKPESTLQRQGNKQVQNGKQPEQQQTSALYLASQLAGSKVSGRARSQRRKSSNSERA